MHKNPADKHVRPGPAKKPASGSIVAGAAGRAIQPRQDTMRPLAPPTVKAKAPARYQPQPTVQMKSPHAGAPPVYRPQPATPARSSAPQVYRPQAMVQAKSAAAAPVQARQPVALAYRQTRVQTAPPPIRRAPSFVINMMPEVGTNAMTSLLTYDYSLAEATLHADEKTELDNLWASRYVVTANTSKKVKRQRATAAANAVKTRLDAMLALPKVTYSAGFLANHISEADVARNTAKTRGEARDPMPPHNTVLKESYIRGLLQADVAGKADGNHWLRFQSPNPSNGRISLATRHGASMTAEDTGLYFVGVRYSLATTADAKRTKTVRAFHMETDDGPEPLDG